MDYFLLETFLVVCETLNLTKAAEVIYKTQPTISHRIKDLEEQLGFYLLIRSKEKRSLSLTSKGKAFLPIAKDLIKLHDEIERVQKNMSQSLTIASIDSIGTTIVPDVCKMLLENANVNLTIHTYQTKESYRLVADREVDIAFVSEYWDMKGVLCEPVFQQEYFVIKPCAYPTAPKYIHPKELAVKNEVFQSWGEDFARWHNKWWPEPSHPRVKVDSNALLIPFLDHPDSWSIIQAGNIAPLQQHMPIQIYRLEDAPPKRSCFMLTNAVKDKYNDYLVKQFKEHLQAYISASTIF